MAFDAKNTAVQVEQLAHDTLSTYDGVRNSQLCEKLFSEFGSLSRPQLNAVAVELETKYKNHRLDDLPVQIAHFDTSGNVEYVTFIGAFLNGNKGPGVAKIDFRPQSRGVFEGIPDDETPRLMVYRDRKVTDK
jgi:hypothetical protein